MAKLVYKGQTIGGGAGSSADNISYDPSTSELTADDVQDAIDELDSVVDKLNSEMPTKLSDLADDSTHRTVTDTQIASWNSGGGSGGGISYQGTLGTNGTISILPEATIANSGYAYKVVTAGTYNGNAATVGDFFISDGVYWEFIPSNTVATKLNSASPEYTGMLSNSIKSFLVDTTGNVLTTGRLTAGTDVEVQVTETSTVSLTAVASKVDSLTTDDIGQGELTLILDCGDAEISDAS